MTVAAAPAVDQVTRPVRRLGPFSSSLVLTALLLVGCSDTDGGTSAPEPDVTPTIAGVQQQAGLSHEHVARSVSYPQRPPMGGQHWPPALNGVRGWQRCAVYQLPVVDEFAVHSLEHGAVWITYTPNLPAAQVRTLTQVAGIRADYVLVSPYPGQPSTVMITAWGAQLGVASADDPRLAQFARQYAGGGQGGELGADCANGADLPTARAALAAAH